MRSRNVVSNIGASIQILFGGNISVYTKLAEQARQEAFDLMVQHAEEAGANAIIAMRYDANEMAAAVTEVIAYGTAVVVEPVAGLAARRIARRLIRSAPRAAQSRIAVKKKMRSWACALRQAPL